MFKQMPADFQVLIWPGNTSFQALHHVCTVKHRGQQPVAELDAWLSLFAVAALVLYSLWSLPEPVSVNYPSPSGQCRPAEPHDKICVILKLSFHYPEVVCPCKPLLIFYFDSVTNKILVQENFEVVNLLLDCFHTFPSAFLKHLCCLCYNNNKHHCNK